MCADEWFFQAWWVGMLDTYTPSFEKKINWKIAEFNYTYKDRNFYEGEKLVNIRKNVFPNNKFSLGYGIF